MTRSPHGDAPPRLLSFAALRRRGWIVPLVVACAAAPANVEWVGFLGPRDYMDAIVAADAVLVLTTEPTSVVRGGYEAVWAHRPLVVSDFPGLRSVFPDAVHVANEAGAIARGIADARERHAELVAAAPGARTRQLDRWTAQLAALEQLTGGHA